MGCGCKERGKIIGQAFNAVKRGNVGQAAQRMGTVVRSMGNDGARAAQNATRQAAARARQMVRR